MPISRAITRQKGGGAADEIPTSVCPKVWGSGFTAKVIYSIVRKAASDCGFGPVAPHDLRRTCARLCHQAGGELEQIQFLLGHVSVQTTERYLRCKQRLQHAVNDRIGLDPCRSWPRNGTGCHSPSCRLQPCINGYLDPRRHRHSSHMTAFAHQVRQDPVILSKRMASTARFRTFRSAPVQRVRR